MIKKSAVLFIVLLSILPAILAVEVDMKTEFKQGETLMAKLSGNFVDSVARENIFFYRGHVRVPMNPNIAKINDEFYIYAQLLDKNPGNYSISLENVRYMKGSQIIDDNVVKNFSINNNTADFSVDPGFVVANNDFFIKVQNLQDSKITININTEAVSGSTKGFFESLFGNKSVESGTPITLNSGEIEKINFKLIDVTESTIKKVTLSTGNSNYEIPIYIFLNKTQQVNTTDGNTREDYGFDLQELNISMSTDSETMRIIHLENTGNVSIKNITLSVSEQLENYITLSVYEIEELEEDSDIKIELYFSSDSEEKSLEGQLKAKSSDNLYAYSSIYLSFIEDYVPSNNSVFVDTKTCEEQGGKNCSLDSECLGKLEGICCFGTCEEKEIGSTGKIIGWAIIVIIVIFLLWFFKKKYKGTKKSPDLLSIAKGK